jgi:hypothetical protein
VPSGNLTDIGFEVNAPYSVKRLEKKLSYNAKGSYISGHIGNEEIISNILLKHKVLYISRNHIDVLWSYVGYVRRTKHHFFHETYRTLGDKKFIELLLRGGKCKKGFIISPWRKVVQKDLAIRAIIENSTNGFLITYEQMINGHVGIEDLQGFLEKEISHGFIDVVGKGKTFSGISGNDKWKDHEWFEVLIHRYVL